MGSIDNGCICITDGSNCITVSSAPKIRFAIAVYNYQVKKEKYQWKISLFL